MTRTPTLEAVATPAAREIFTKLEEAITEAVRVRTIVDRIATEYLAETTILDDEGERITTAANLYRIDCDEYFGTVQDELRYRQIKANVRSEALDPEFCPALVAESIRINLENDLIRETGGALGLGGASLYGTIRADWLRLASGLLRAA